MNQLPAAVLPAVLAVVAVLAGCGSGASGTHAAPAAPTDMATTDPCTLLNLQQQNELGRVNTVQPSSAEPPDSACAYVHSDPPSWTVTITVGPDRGSKRDPSAAQSSPEDLTVEGFAATRQRFDDGCIVEVQTKRVEGFAVRATGGAPESACASATKAAQLAAVTVRRRH